MFDGDLITRGSKEPTPVGTATFIGLRAVEPILQYGILRHGYGSSLFDRLGTKATAMGPPSNTGLSLIDNLTLSPYRLILVGMAGIGALKQIGWEIGIALEPMPVPAAVTVGIFNFIVNGINNLLFTCAATSPAYGRGEGPHWEGWPGPQLVVGGSLFAVGITTELVSEIQRYVFKKDPQNNGKAYTGGLFGLSRHINYFGYTLWRTGFAAAAGGWIWAAITAGYFTWDFNSRAIPVLDKYCSQRYGDMWKIYKQQTPYQFVPYVY